MIDTDAIFDKVEVGDVVSYRYGAGKSNHLEKGIVIRKTYGPTNERNTFRVINTEGKELWRYSASIRSVTKMGPW